MLTIRFTLTCSQKTFDVEVHSNEYIREGFMRLIRTKEEYYKKIRIDGMTLKGEKIEMDDKFIEVDAEDNDNIIVLCKFKVHTNIDIGCVPPLPQKNKLSLCYFTDTDNTEALIFGEKFFNREKDNMEVVLIENNEGKTNQKVEDFKIFFPKGGVHIINISFKKQLTNFSYMFCACYNLLKIEGDLDVSQSTDFGWMFGGCSSLREIDSLERWNMGNAKNIRCMFFGCSSLTKLEKLSNWDTHNIVNFDTTFGGCSSLQSLKGLENWDVSNGEDFGTTFYGGMFSGCCLIKNLDILKDWNVSKGKNFEWMFMGCSSLEDVNGIERWNVDNGVSFLEMFKDCPLIRAENVPMNLREKTGIFNSL